MISTILASGDSLKQRLRRSILYLSRKSGARKAWKKRHQVVFERHPDYRRALSGTAEKKHRERWGVFSRHVPIETLRICGIITGGAHPDTVPEEIFQADIEPTLNRTNEAHYLADKSFYTRWLPEAGFPDCLLHKVNGELLDRTYTTLSVDRLAEYINSMKYPVLVKPAAGFYGGSGVQFIQSASELRDVLLQQDNIVVQELVLQSPHTGGFHPQSLNTVRVYLYRSVCDNRIHILNRAFRTGNGGQIDNVAAGGLVTFLHGRGDLNGFALDRYGGRFDTHPVTGKPFTGQLPNIKQLDSLAKEVAHKLFRLRVVGLDLYCDNNDQWNMLEINTKGHSIRFSQYHGFPFFGEFTDEVIEYCKENHWALSV